MRLIVRMASPTPQPRLSEGTATMHHFRGTVPTAMLRCVFGQSSESLRREGVCPRACTLSVQNSSQSSSHLQGFVTSRRPRTGSLQARGRLRTPRLVLLQPTSSSVVSRPSRSQQKDPGCWDEDPEEPAAASLLVRPGRPAASWVRHHLRDATFQRPVRVGRMLSTGHLHIAATRENCHEGPGKGPRGTCHRRLKEVTVQWPAQR